jgi:hypothetical protein
MSIELRYVGMIAPCGMNCGLCIGHLREKKPCGGCFRKDDETSMIKIMRVPSDTLENLQF